VRRAELESALLASAQVTGEIEFVLVGSQCLHAHAVAPLTEVILSVDCDLYPKLAPEKTAMLREKLGKGSVFHVEHGFFVDGVEPDSIQLAEGWEGRLTPMRVGEVTAWCLSVADLLIAKLFAGRLKDYEFIQSALKCCLADGKQVSALIETFPELHTRAVLGARLRIASESVG
jgi:hypothetical protein